MECKLFSNEELKKWSEVDPEYKIIVQDAVCSDKNLQIENSDMEHAKFLSYLLIQKAKKNIKIFTGKLKEVFYTNPKILQAFKDAIKRNVTIEIVTSTTPEKSEFLSLHNKNKDKLIIRRLSNPSYPANHFLISDNSAYRLEAPHTDEDIKLNKVKGIVNFNDPKFAKEVSSFFDKTLLSNSAEI